MSAQDFLDNHLLVKESGFDDAVKHPVLAGLEVAELLKLSILSELIHQPPPACSVAP